MHRPLTLAAVLVVTSLATAQPVYEWRRHDGAVKPLARNHHRMAYDAARGETILFGGRTAGGFLGDTWAYDGSGWRQIRPQHSPLARAEHAMTYDPLRQRVVLFGGTDGADFDDIWEWDGNDWTQVAQSVRNLGPNGSCCFDPRLGEVFFNRRATNLLWNGSRLLTPNVATPDAGAAGEIVYDAGFGGPVTPFLSGLKVFRPVEGWVDAVQGSLFQLFSYAMAIDPVSQHIVLQGGSGSIANGRSSGFRETFLFDGSAWSQLPDLPSPPSGRYRHAMTFDLHREVFVHFGGDTNQSIEFTDETWELVRVEPDASFKLFGSGCSGSSATTPLLQPETLFNSVPVLGGTFTLRLDRAPSMDPAWLVLGTSNTNWTGGSLPLDLTALGMAGCQLLASPNIVEPMITGLGSGRLWITLPIPSDRAFLGADFYVQAISSDPAANAPGLTWSNGGHGVIGIRP